MTLYEIPLTPEPQVFTINLGGVNYLCSILWNYVSGNWNLDLTTEDGIPFLRGIPLVPNTNLLEQYAYLRIGGELFLDSNPSFNSLGVTSHLFFRTP